MCDSGDAMDYKKLISRCEKVCPFTVVSGRCFTIVSRVGQSSLDTKVLVRLNILAARIFSLLSLALDTRTTDWPDILIDHQSFHSLKPLADGFHGLPSIALMKLGSSFPPPAETRPLLCMNS